MDLLFKYCITFLALSVSGNALATLIDFEDVITPAGNHIIVNSVTTDGFILSRDGTGHIDVGSATEIDYANNGTQVAFVPAAVTGKIDVRNWVKG